MKKGVHFRSAIDVLLFRGAVADADDGAGEELAARALARARVDGASSQAADAFGAVTSPRAAGAPPAPNARANPFAAPFPAHASRWDGAVAPSSATSMPAAADGPRSTHADAPFPSHAADGLHHASPLCCFHLCGWDASSDSEGEALAEPLGDADEAPRKRSRIAAAV